MSNILDTLKKQAAAVVHGPKTAQVAELLRQAAALLEEDQPKKESSAITKKRNIDERAARVEKFGAAMRSVNLEKRHTMLVQAGWVQGQASEKTGVYSYGCKAKPGVQLKIADGKFSVIHGPAVLQEKISTEGLSNFLTWFKKENSL